MEKYNVTISSSAQSDFLRIVEQINSMPPEEAVLCFDQILYEAAVLLESPTSCPFARDSQLRMRRYRILTVDSYIFFFVVNGNTVEIRRILYSRRQYERLL